MKKLESLRAHLIQFPARPAIDPNNLLVFADKGTVAAMASGTNEHFELRYQGNIIIRNFAAQADQLFFWVLQWLRESQPEHAMDAVSFEADLLNEKSADVSITIPLVETVMVERTAAGITLTHADEPNLEAQLLDATEWTAFLNDGPDPLTTWMQGD